MFDENQLDLCALTETRITDFDKTKIGNVTFLNSGRSDGMHYQGVGLLLNSKATSALIKWEPVSERILTARLNRCLKA